MLHELTNEQIENRLDWVERMLLTAPDKDLPYLKNMIQKMIDELARRDAEKTTQ